MVGVAGIVGEAGTVITESAAVAAGAGVFAAVAAAAVAPGVAATVLAVAEASGAVDASLLLSVAGGAALAVLSPEVESLAGRSPIELSLTILALWVLSSAMSLSTFAG
jgi:hypothetical protein